MAYKSAGVRCRESRGPVCGDQEPCHPESQARIPKSLGKENTPGIVYFITKGRTRSWPHPSDLGALEFLA